MKLYKTIVNEAYKLIGFIVKGTAQEFGGFGNGSIERPVQTGELIKSNFNNEQVEVRGNKLHEKKGFKFSDLEMVMYKDNSFIAVGNEIKILRRVLVNGKLKGFDISIGGTGNYRYTYENVIRLCSWCKPENFTIRVTSNNTAYIAGKNIRLQDLPEEEVGHNVETSKRKRTQYGGQKQEILNKEEELSTSLLELYSYIKSCDGVIIKLADEHYKAAGVQTMVTPDTFMPLGVGEIGSPYIDFSNSSLNANTLFKKVGTISAEICGNVNQLYTFTWSSKSLFVNGANYIKRFGIGVTKDVADKIIQKFGEKLVTRVINDKRVITPIVSLTGKKDYVFFEVDTTKLTIMNKETAKECYLSNKEVYDIVKELTALKVNQKIMNGYIKHLKEENPNLNLNKGKELFGLYRGMTKEALLEIASLGIDIYTGAYTVKEKVEKSVAAEISEKESVSNRIEVEYSLAKVNLAKITYASISDAIQNNKEITEYCSDMTKKVIKMPGQDGIDGAKAYLEYIKDKISKLTYKLWLHRMAMYTLGKDKLYMSESDLGEWSEKKSRAKTGKQYECASCPNLILKVTNIDI